MTFTDLYFLLLNELLEAKRLCKISRWRWTVWSVFAVPGIFLFSESTVVAESSYGLLCNEWVFILKQIKVCRCFMVLFCNAVESHFALCSMLAEMSEHLPGMHFSFQHSLVICFFLNLQGKKCVQWHSLFRILLKCAFTLCLKKQTKPNAFRRFDLISVFTHLRDYFNYNTKNTVVTQAWVLFPNLTRETFENNLWTLLQNILGSKRIFHFSAEVYLIHVKLPAWEGLKRGVLPHVLVSFSSELL